MYNSMEMSWRIIRKYEDNSDDEDYECVEKRNG